MRIKRKKGVQKKVRCTREHGCGFLKEESQKEAGMIPVCLWAPGRKVALLIKFLLKPSAEVDMMGGRWIGAGFCFFP